LAVTSHGTLQGRRNGNLAVEKQRNLLSYCNWLQQAVILTIVSLSTQSRNMLTIQKHEHPLPSEHMAFHAIC